MSCINQIGVGFHKKSSNWIGLSIISLSLSLSLSVSVSKKLFVVLNEFLTYSGILNFLYGSILNFFFLLYVLIYMLTTLVFLANINKFPIRNSLFSLNKMRSIQPGDTLKIWNKKKKENATYIRNIISQKPRWI